MTVLLGAAQEMAARKSQWHGTLVLIGQPSEEIIQGSAALLAMAAGVPVVASRVGGLPEAVVDGETGLLVENDPDAVSDAVRTLLADRERARAMGAAARAKILNEFTAPRIAEQTEALYRRVLSAKC